MASRGRRRTAVRVLVVLGAAAAVTGAAGAVVFQLQPWRSCPDDTVPAACPMLQTDYDAFLAFVLVLLAGCVLLLAALVVRQRLSRSTSAPWKRSPHATRIGPTRGQRTLAGQRPDR